MSLYYIVVVVVVVVVLVYDVVLSGVVVAANEGFKIFAGSFTFHIVVAVA